MASITSLSNSSYNTNSIYGSRNVLSGLASGLDTETMIENAVSGIKMKITSLLQKRTKVEWQQEAYRSIIDKAVDFNTRYTSYSSKTNLMSSSFFNNAVITTTNGSYANKISASGKTSSDIKINSVSQLATAASYTVSGLAGIASGGTDKITGDAFDYGETINVSTVSGSLSLKYGGSNGATFTINFGELEDLNEYEGDTSAQKLANAINQKLSEIDYTYTQNGFSETTTADKAIKAVANDDGRIVFVENELNTGNEITIGSVSGKIKSTLGLSSGDKVITVANTELTEKVPTYKNLTGKSLSFTYNGTTKTINMNDVMKGINYEDDNANELFTAAIQKELDNAFGSGKVEASYDGGRLSFRATEEGNTLIIGGTAAESLGFQSGDANYINTGKKLTDILGEDFFKENGYDFEINGAHIKIDENTTLESLMNSINSNADTGVKVSYSKLTNEFKFTATETGANSKIEMGGLAKAMFGTPGDGGSGSAASMYGVGENEWLNFKINGETIRSFVYDDSRADALHSDSTMYDIAEALSKHPQYNATYNELSGQLVITDKNGKTVDYEVTVSSEINGQGTARPAAYKPTSTYTAGQDAVMDVEINGKRFENFTRSGNSFDIDGLTINVKGTFSEDTFKSENGDDYEAVSFTTATDTDTIVDAIRSFVEDYNAMATEIKNAYSTMPATKSDGSRYNPLTAEDEESMSESAIKSYEETAKQGILFGDTTLSSMYSKLLSAIAPGGTDGQTLREIGIGTSYSNGMTTINLDEDKLRAALESDPDKVKNAFTKSRDGGSSTDGLMTTLQNTLNTYVKTTGEPKGALITRAGSVKAYTSLSNNTLQKQINSIDSQIQRWQNKMSDQIDRYTTQFTRLEQLIAEMNSQASSMAGLLGGSSGGYGY